MIDDSSAFDKSPWEKLYEAKGVGIIEVKACPDHVHMTVGRTKTALAEYTRNQLQEDSMQTKL